MKNFYTLPGLVAMLLLLISCDNFRSDHKQAGMNQSGDTPLKEQDILSYADSITINLLQFQKHESLVYTRGASTLQVTKYLANGQAVLYIANTEDEGSGSEEKRYFVKDGHLLLCVSSLKQSADAPARVTRLYFRNDVMFYAEERQAGQRDDFKKVEAPGKDYVKELETLEDAIGQRGPFDLAFEEFTDYPGSRYIVLGGKAANGYRAAVKVEEEDAFTQELSRNSALYQGRELSLRWTINADGEAVYESGQVK